MFDPTDAPITQILVAWLATYLIHSTILIAAVWAVGRALGDRRLPLQDALWKAAMFGGILTATLQTAGGPTLFPLQSAAEPPVALGQLAPAPPLAMEPGPMVVRAPAATWTLPELGLGLWLAGAAVSLLFMVATLASLQRRLSDRREVTSGRLRATFESLKLNLRRTRARLTTSGRIDVPLALELSGPEVCVPTRTLPELEPDAQEAVLAHELAHLERRDPTWSLGARVVRSIFFFQPLNHLAFRRWAEVSECLCDEWAAHRTGRPLTLARCLTDVAEWLVHDPAPLPAMASNQSALARRVRRLIRLEGPPSGTSHWSTAVALVGLLVVACAAPGAKPPADAAAAVPTPSSDEGPEVANEDPLPPLPSGPRGPAVGDDIEHDGEYERWEELPPDPEWEAQLAEEMDRMRGELSGVGADLDHHPDAIRELHELQERLSRELVGIGSVSMSPEERARLEAEVRALAERVRPTEEEVRALHRRAREAAERVRLSSAEIDELRAAAEEAARAARLREHDVEQMRREAEEAARRFELRREEIERMQAEALEQAERAAQMTEEQRATAREHAERALAAVEAARREAEERAMRQEAELQAEVVKRQHQELRDLRRELDQQKAMLEDERRQLEAERRELEAERRRLETERESDR